MKVALTPEARSDLRDIADHIASDNPERARSFLDELSAKCLDLGDMPQRFAVIDRYRQSGIRRRLHRGYLIFYRIEAAQVTILRIVHGARDYDRLLAPE